MADIRVVADDLQTPYGLAFDAEGVLFVSESDAGRVSRVDNGRAELFAQTGSRPRGIAFDDSGDLFVAEAGRHHLILISPDEAIEVYASSCRGRRFVHPRELCFAPTGDVLFTDEGHGEQEDGAVFRADLDGEVTEIAKGLSKPAGMILSEDASVLYVSERGQRRVVSLEIDEEGHLENQQVFIEFAEGESAECLLFDAHGQLYVSRPGTGVDIYDPEGKHVSTLDLPGTQVSGMTFGGLEFDELHVCVGSQVCAVQTEVPGQRPFAGPRSV